MAEAFAICPRCKTGLDRRGTRLFCGRCQGSLVTHTELGDLVASELATAEPESVPDLEEMSALFSKSEVNDVEAKLLAEIETDEPKLRCPACPNLMKKHRLRGELTDLCSTHGVWFDGGELERVLPAGKAPPAGNRMVMVLVAAVVVLVAVVAAAKFL